MKSLRSFLLPLALLTLIALSLLLAVSFPHGQNWTHYVRIAAFGLERTRVQDAVRQAQEDHVFGIEVDNDITGRYESFLDPTAKLAAIHAVAEAAHKAGNRAFVYIAGTECITANADKTQHTMAKDHPEWLQRKLDGTPAIFGGGTAFWIRSGDEDVWISPYAADWRKTYMERVRQIAATGIDGIYVDIPYWMTHFGGWEDSWASFDDFTVAAFRKETGLDARQLKLGDFSDPNFRKWVDFRIRTLTEFMREIDQNAKSVNPEIKTIPEIYPGIEREAVVVGADVYEMYGVVDAIAHEYEFGGGDHMATSRTPLDWFKYMVGWSSFRSFAGGKATWMLNYSWDEDKTKDRREAMKNLFAAELLSGVNVWDAPGHSMAGSNDRPTRQQVFQWIAAHERTFYAPRLPLDPVGVYFSPATRNYFANDFISSYRGIVILLLQKHWEHQIVTPRNLAEFRGKALILPDVRVLNDAERAALKQFVANGGRLVITGTDATQLGDLKNVVRFPDCPGRTYLNALEKEFRPNPDAEFLNALQHKPALELSGSPWLGVQLANVEGKRHIFITNVQGITMQPGLAAKEENVILHARGKAKTLYWLPFLGEVQKLSGQRTGDVTEFSFPPIERGGVAWLE